MVKLRKHKRLVIYVVLVVVAIVGAAGYFGVMAYRSASLEQKKPLTPEEKVAQLVGTDDTTKLSDAKKELPKLADKESNTKTKAVYLSGAATVFARTGDYKSAVSYAQQAENSDQTVENAATVGAYAQEAGDYVLAAKYFAIAADRSPEPHTQSPYSDYKLMQKEAESLIR